MAALTIHINNLCLPDQSGSLPPQWHSTVDGTIYVELDGVCFPDNTWFDLPLSLLEMWNDQLRDYFACHRHSSITLRFMDGPFAVQLSPISDGAAMVSFLEAGKTLEIGHQSYCIDLADFARTVLKQSDNMVIFCEANGEYKACAALKRSANRLRATMNC